MMNGKLATAEKISRALENGETDFVAAGGDGTVNALLNHLLSLTNPRYRDHIRLGAIGLGSSNDFHKPFSSEHMMEGISCKVNFAEAKPRDVGCITYEHNGRFVSSYFLVNASVGVTAEANRFFNNPDRTLKLLKQLFTPGAILYAILKTICSFNNVEVRLRCRENTTVDTNMTNLAVLKNPHVSGRLRYDSPLSIDNGSLIVRMCHDMNRPELIKLLWALAHQKINTVRKTKSWSTTSMMVSAKTPFAVEFDGETIETRRAHFSILPKCIKVCP